MEAAFRLSAVGLGSGARATAAGDALEAVVQGVPVRAELSGGRLLVRGAGATRKVELTTRTGAKQAVPTGDALFDAAVRVLGDEADVRALLGHPLRACVLELARHGDVALRQGAVELTASLAGLDPARIQLLLRAVARVVLATLEVPGDTADAIARVLREDPEPRVRYLALRKLAAAFPERAAGVAHEAARDPAPINRALGGALLEDEGLPVLRDLIANGRDVEAAAIASRLIARREDREAEPALILALAQEDIRIRRLAIEILEQLGTVRAVEPLLDLAARPATLTLEKASVERAVKAIQARLDGVEPGRLSISAGAEDGALSLADGARGALSKT